MSAASKDTLKPTLCKKFKGIVWRIETDETNSHIALETRDPDSKAVNFSVLNYKTGESLLNEIRTENDGWWNMDRIQQNTLFLHGYLSENTPEHKGICAIDVWTGDIRWQNFQLALEDISEEGLIAYNPSLQPRKYQLISPFDGTTIQATISNYSALPREIIFPEIVTDTTLIPAYLPKNIVGPINYIKINGKECWSYHTESQGSFSQELLILQDGEVILSDILASGIQKLNPEAFFIQQNCLFCIRGNNKEIVTYLL
jgi:hypothetical protein